VEHGLHSKAAGLLQLLLQEDLLTPDDFGANPTAAAAAGDAADVDGAAAVDGDVTAGRTVKKARRAAKGERLHVVAGLRMCLALCSCTTVTVLLAVLSCNTSDALHVVSRAAQMSACFGMLNVQALIPFADWLCCYFLAGLTRELLRVRCTAVAAAAFARLWEHTRRGSTAALWEVLNAVLQRRLAAAEAAAAADSSSSSATNAARSAEAVSDAARAVMLLAQGVHYFRGSRVEDYAPLVTLAGRLVTLLPVLQQLQQQGGEQQQQEQPVLLQLQLIQQQAEEHSFTAVDFAGLTLSHSIHQLVLGVVLGHTKEVGASKGLSFLKPHAARWAGLFNQGLVPDRELLGFIQGLVTPPSSAAAAELFAPQLLGALGKLLLRQLGSTTDNPAAAAAAGSTGGSSSSSSVGGQALAMLIEVCELLRPAATVGSGLPLLLTAQPGGVELAAAVQQLANSWKAAAAAGSTVDATSALLYCWAGLQLLPHACAKAEDTLSTYRNVMSECNAAIAALEQQQQAAGAATSNSSVSIKDLLQLRGMALTMLAQLLPAAAPLQLPNVAADALAWLQQQDCRDYATVSATAMVLEAVKIRLADPAGFAGTSDAAADAAAVADAAARARLLLSSHQLPAVVQLLLPCLTAASQKLRAAALQLLCSFDQPAFLGTGGINNSSSNGSADPASQSHPGQQGQAERAAFEGLSCDVLLTLRDIHLRPCSVEAGRRWAVALERISNHLEYGRVPALLLPALVAGLIGALHIR
jgi:U3 small nucleolar RNA-associated protein 20